MSKFLKLVQENTPEEEDGKGPYTFVCQDKQGKVMAKVTVPDSVSAWWHHFSEFIENSGGYDLEVEKKLPVEDNELKDKIEGVTAIMNIPDQGILGQVMSPAARNIQMAKRNYSKGAKIASKKFLDAMTK